MIAEIVRLLKKPRLSINVSQAIWMVALPDRHLPLGNGINEKVFSYRKRKVHLVAISRGILPDLHRLNIHDYLGQRWKALEKVALAC